MCGDHRYRWNGVSNKYLLLMTRSNITYSNTEHEPQTDYPLACKDSKDLYLLRRCKSDTLRVSFIYILYRKIFLIFEDNLEHTRRTL